MSEITASSSGDKETDGGYLKVSPSGIITFVKDGNELISTLELQNTDASTHVSYKLKTTSPEKFRVKPSTGCLAPGESANVNVTLLPGFTLGGLSRDKFLVMSTPMESSELEGLDLPELWKGLRGFIHGSRNQREPLRFSEQPHVWSASAHTKSEVKHMYREGLNIYLTRIPLAEKCANTV